MMPESFLFLDQKLWGFFSFKIATRPVSLKTMDKWEPGDLESEEVS